MTDHQKLIALATGEAATSYEQRNAIAALGKLDDRDSLNALIRLLNEEDRYLRRDVVKSIGTHGSPSSVLALIHCLFDFSENIRRDAASILGSKNDGRAIGPLKELLKDKGYAVRHAAESSLALLEREGIQPIEFNLDELSEIESLRDPNSPPPTVAASPVAASPVAASPVAASPVASPPADETGTSQTLSPVESRTAAPTTNNDHDPLVTEANSAQTGFQTEPEVSKTPTTQTNADETSNKDASGIDVNSPSEPSNSPYSTLSDTSNSDTASPNATETHAPTKRSSEPTNTPLCVPNATQESLETPPEALSSIDSPDLSRDKPEEADADEEIILAELVQESSLTEPVRPKSQITGFDEHHSDLTVQQLVSPTPASDFSWTTATRFHAFFATNLDVIRTQYMELHELQQEEIIAENRFSEALLEHDLVYADLADDAEQNETESETQLDSIKQVANERESLAIAIKRTKRASSSITGSISDFFWPSRTKSLQQKSKHLQEKITRADEHGKLHSDALIKAQKAADAAKQTLKKAEQRVIDAGESATAAHRKVQNIQRAIDNSILSELNDDKSPGIDFLLDHCSSRHTLKCCIEELRQHRIDYSSLKKALFELESPLNADNQTFTNAAERLAASVANGFAKKTRNQKIKTYVNCSVLFHSASVSTSSTLRLDGKAQGHANLAVNYEYDEFDWEGGETFSQSLADVNNSATQLGTLQALHAVRSTELASVSYSIRNCVAYIRAELERDFEAPA